jgi:hypothetical protein
LSITSAVKDPSLTKVLDTMQSSRFRGIERIRASFLILKSAGGFDGVEAIVPSLAY